jgi:hypothetical protein
MATKAERFKAEMQRAGSQKRKRKKATKPPPPLSVAGKVAPRKPKARKANSRQKAAAPLKAKQLLALISPHSRHDSAIKQ